MTAARQLSERPCRSLGPCQRTTDTQMTAVAPAVRAAMLVTRCLPKPSLPHSTRPPSQWHRKGHVYILHGATCLLRKHVYILHGATCLLRKHRPGPISS
jgi:hypothetical protein